MDEYYNCVEGKGKRFINTVFESVYLVFTWKGELQTNLELILVAFFFLVAGTNNSETIAAIF